MIFVFLRINGLAPRALEWTETPWGSAGLTSISTKQELKA